MSFLFIKQKTAYEMRISDWSSDVCSSDLPRRQAPAEAVREAVLVEQGDAEALVHGPAVADVRPIEIETPRRLDRHARGAQLAQRPGVDRPARRQPDRPRDVEGQSVSVRVELVGGRSIRNKNKNKQQ